MSDRWEEILGVGEKLVDDFKKVSGQISSSARGILSSEAFLFLQHPTLFSRKTSLNQVELRDRVPIC